ncbi:MAG: glycosyltransferase [Clostridium perfringens]|nr:glycosyltransferase [Clostridium perfringens]
MISISLCMIVKDEEKNIERCLSSVEGIVDEIIIVDTGSKDKTKVKVKEHGARIYDFKWENDFSEARNFSFSKATKDYILWLDADDVLKYEHREELLKLKDNLGLYIDSVVMNHVLACNEEGEPISYLKRNRLMKRICRFKWKGRVYEDIDVRGNTLNSDICIIHKRKKEHVDRKFEICEIMRNEKVDFSARELYFYANELYDYKMYDEAIEEYIKFFNKEEFLLEDTNSACLRIADCYRNKGEEEKEFEFLFKSFQYNIPSSEVCCRIGSKFLDKKQYNKAIFWYNTAIKNKPEPDYLGLINSAYHTWVPYLQLCICYCYVGEFEFANKCNEIALRYNKNHPSILKNRTYLKERI